MNSEWKYWSAFLTGVILLFWGFIAPPYGEISQSVLVASGELLILAAAIVGIDLTFDFKNHLLGKNKSEKKNADSSQQQ